MPYHFTKDDVSKFVRQVMVCNEQKKEDAIVYVLDYLLYLYEDGYYLASLDDIIYAVHDFLYKNMNNTNK